jgi:hypothetical protein
MRQASTEENSASGLTPPKSPWRVEHVEPLDGYCLRVQFQDGTIGTVDLAGLVHSADAGVVTWPGEIDLAPDAMHRAIRDHGEYGEWIVIWPVI